MGNEYERGVGYAHMGMVVADISERSGYSAVSSSDPAAIRLADTGRGRYVEEAGTGKAEAGTQAAAPLPAVARKNDEGKADLAIIPEAALVEMAKAFQVGEKKYGRYNYLAGGFTICRITAAMIRHAYAYLRGEEYDPKDGQHHLGSVLACAGMLLDLRARGKLIDDRYVDPDKKVKS